MVKSFWSSVAGIFVLALTGILFSLTASFGADGSVPNAVLPAAQPQIEVGNMTQTLTVSNKPDPRKTLTTEEVASLVGCNADTIRRRASNGTLNDFVKVDRNKWRARFAREMHVN